MNALCPTPTRSLTHAQAEDGNEGWSGILSSARAQLNPLDLFFVQTERNESKVGVLNVGWGIINDIHESDAAKGNSEEGSGGGGGSRLRFLGQTRLSVMRLVAVTNLKTNSAVLSYLPVEHSRRPFKNSSGGGGDSNSNSRSSPVRSSSSSFSSYTCSTCSLTDREHVFNKELSSSSAAGSKLKQQQKQQQNRSFELGGGQDSMDALITSKPSINNDNNNNSKPTKTKPKRYQSPIHPPPPPPPPPPMLAPSQPTATRYNYTSLLTEGQLYFRSWQELDVRLRHSGPFPMLNSHPGLMKPGGPSSLPPSKRPKPHFPSMPDLPKPLPKDAGWITEVGDFVSVHLLNQGFIDKSRLLVADCLPDDGLLWLLLIRAGISRRDLLKFLR